MAALFSVNTNISSVPCCHYSRDQFYYWNWVRYCVTLYEGTQIWDHILAKVSQWELLCVAYRHFFFMVWYFNFFFLSDLVRWDTDFSVIAFTMKMLGRMGLLAWVRGDYRSLNYVAAVKLKFQSCVSDEFINDKFSKLPTTCRMPHMRKYAIFLIIP